MKRKWSTMLGIAIVVGAVFVLGSPRTPVQAQSGGAVGAAQPAMQAEAQGNSAYAAVPTQVVLRDLPLASVAPSTTLRMHPRPLNGASDAEWAAKKAQAALARFPNPVQPLGALGPQMFSAGLGSADTPGAIINFDGDVMSNGICSGWIPADQALAIGDGSNPILQSVNQCLSVFAANGTRLVGPVTLQSFFGLAGGTFVSDPRALFDWYNHRFIVTMLDSNGSNSNNYDIAVSAGDDPTGGWWIYRLGVPSTANALNDYPRVGQDRTAYYPGTNTLPGAIYLASNLFSNSSGAYLYEEWLTLPKNRMYQGLGFSYWYFYGMTSGGVYTDTSQPVNVMSPYEQPRAEYFITSKNINNGGGQCSTGCNGLTVWAISNPFGFNVGGPSPEFSGVVIGTANNYALAPNATQPGGPANIETIDTRISGEATYAHGLLHAALDGSNGAGGTQSHIYQVRPFLNRSDDGHCPNSGVSYYNYCPQITGAIDITESILNYGGNAAAFFPTPQPDLEGNITTVYNFSSSGAYVGLAYISQRITGGNGFVDSGYYLAVGGGQYTRGRWGDYTAVAPAGIGYAPGNGGLVAISGMGFSGMYSGNANNWRTRIGYNRFTSPGQP